MRLVRAVIRRMPGLTEGYTLGELKSVVLLLGPNGSGKSTLRRAVHALLWPETEPSLDVSLRFEWQDEDGPLVVEREGARVVWTRQGKPCEPPALPPASLASSLSFGSEDLVAADDTTSGQAREIARELAGGYEVEPLVTERAISSGSRGKVYTDWNEAREQTRRVEREQRKIAEDERSLSALEDALAAAENARAGLACAADALTYAEACAELRAAEGRLAEFPKGIERLGGDELSRLEELDEKRARLAEELDLKTRESRQAQEEADPLRFPETVDEARLKRASGEADALVTLERDLLEGRARLESLERRRDEAAARVGGRGKPPQLKPESVKRIEEVFLAEWTLRQRRLALEEELRGLGLADKEERDPEPSRRAAEALRASLAGAGGARNAWWLGSIALACAAGALGWAAFQGLSMPFSAVASALMALLALGAFMAGRRPSGRMRILALLEEAGAEAPSRWERGTLEETLRALDADANRSEGESLLFERERGLRARLDALGEEVRDAEQEREEAAAACSLDPAVSGLALNEMANALREWREKHDEIEQHAAALAGVEARIKAHRDSLSELLGEVGASCEPKGVAFRVELDRLLERGARLGVLDRERDLAERDALRIRSNIESIKSDRARVLHGTGLGERELDELARRIERLEEFRKARSAFEAARAVASATRARAGLPEEAGDPQALRAELEELERAAEPVDSLREEVAGLRERVRVARTGHALEEALANEEARRADVLEAREGELDGAMGAFLLRRASQRHELSSMPDRLAEASRLLERFTQGRYSLQLSGTLDEARRFVAHDSVADRLLDLNQLSSGTRSQLLLAARVAFALAEEGSAALPFFLDETLSQADPERFRAVAQALLVLANEGRQVFYLTCQPADASFWRTEAEQIDSSLLSIQDLVEIRGLERSAELPVVEPGEPALPSPSGLSPQEYARELALPPLDPTRGVSEAHLFYPLSEQLELLYDLLSSRVERVGPWRVHEKRGSAGPLLGGPERAAQVSARVKALGAFLEARRVGRGAPLHRKALADAGVSETFMEPVAELAEEVEWDAARVVEGLRDKRVKRFRAAAIDTIEEFLLDEGFLDPRDMLDEDEIRARVYASLAGELEAGALPREELNALLERWLAAVSRRAACPR